jgi:hypothetical protein
MCLLGSPRFCCTGSTANDRRCPLVRLARKGRKQLPVTRDSACEIDIELSLAEIYDGIEFVPEVREDEAS